LTQNEKGPLTFIILSLTAKSFCQLNYTLKINDLAQINFPDTPLIKQMPGNVTVYGYQGIEESYIFQISSFRRTDNDLFRKDANNKFYTEQINEVLDHLKAKPIYRKNILINGIDGAEYAYSFNAGEVKLFSYNQIVFFNDTILDYYVLSRDSLQENNDKIQSYFSSFKITEAKKNLITTNQDRSIRIFEILIWIAVIILLGLGIVFLIKKTAYIKK